MADLIPTTIGNVLILVLGILPGMPGELVFSQITGRSWLENKFTHLMRVLGFSVAGVVFYGAVAGWAGFALPNHVVPATFLDGGFTASALPALSAGYIGHFVVATISGAVAAFGVRQLRRRFPAAIPHEDAWDDFVKIYAPNRWVVVRLRDGEAYAGMLQQADIARDPDYRDVVLAEPAAFDDACRNYVATSNQYLYLRGSQITSIGALANNDEERITRIDQPIFPEREG